MTGVANRALKGGAISIEPLAVSIADAIALSGLSRSEIYRRIGSGQLEARKATPRRTVIIFASLKRHLAALPSANVRPTP
jgi:hypothetical protein